MNNKIILLLLGFCSIHLVAQQTVASDTLARTATFGYDIQGNQIDFSPQTPPLMQIAGAPQAFYSYYWEFGDGHYSREKNPEHIYEKEGDYEVNLWVTNHYDNGKAPATRPQRVKVNEITKEFEPSASLNDTIQLLRNRDPIPNEEIVVVMTYQNPANYVTSGKLYFFYNDNEFKNDNFELIETRTHHGEQQRQDPLFASSGIYDEPQQLLATLEHGTNTFPNKWANKENTAPLSQTLQEAREHYRDHTLLEFDTMQPGEERNIFFTLRTTPQMLKDTSAIVTVRSIYIPDSNFDNHKIKEMEMEIVTSYDPNKMSSNATLLNYRLVRFKTFKFKIDFQNSGEGPARTIRLETDIPKMFDKSTLKITDLYPKVPICPEEDVIYSCIDTTFTDTKAIFTFKNIYLPGSEQKNVKEFDSTRGHVRYQIDLAKDFHKISTRSRTAIYFDKNEPIITNYATTRFMPGISIGAKAGYMITPELDNHREYFVGATISPYMSYRGYLQAELMISANSFDELSQFREETTIDNGFVETYDIEQLKEHQNISLYLVPASYRYNLNNFLAVGTGVQLKLNLSSEVCEKNTGEYNLFIPSEGITFRDDTKDFTTLETTNTGFDNFQTGIFADFNAGIARIGPSGGVRYVYNFNAPNSQIQFYAIWKF